MNRPGMPSIVFEPVLEMGVRRGRHSDSRRDSALADLNRLPIWIDPETDVHAWGETLWLAEVRVLTLDNATYLELALRHSLPVATLD